MYIVSVKMCYAGQMKNCQKFAVDKTKSKTLTLNLSAERLCLCAIYNFLFVPVQKHTDADDEPEA